MSLKFAAGDGAAAAQVRLGPGWQPRWVTPVSLEDLALRREVSGCLCYLKSWNWEARQAGFSDQGILLFLLSNATIPQIDIQEVKMNNITTHFKAFRSREISPFLSI